jgi:hypothetical protein
MTRPIAFNDGINIFTTDEAAPSRCSVRSTQFIQAGGNHEPLAARTTHRHGLLFLPADLDDRLQISILRADHVEHPLMFRRSLKECGKIFVKRVLHRGRVAAVAVIDRLMDERGNCLRTIGTYGARYLPKYPTLIQCTPHSVHRNARTQSGALFHFNIVTFVAKLSEAYGWKSKDYR